MSDDLEIKQLTSFGDLQVKGDIDTIKQKSNKGRKKKYQTVEEAAEAKKRYFLDYYQKNKDKMLAHNKEYHKTYPPAIEKWYCEICDIHILVQNVPNHLVTKRHAHNLDEVESIRAIKSGLSSISSSDSETSN